MRRFRTSSARAMAGAALACLLLLLPGCGSGGGDGGQDAGKKGGPEGAAEPASGGGTERPGTQAPEEKGDPVAAAPGKEPSPEPSPGPADPPGPGAAEDAARPWRYALPAGRRLAYQIQSSFATERDGEVVEAVDRSGWAFLRILAHADGGVPVVRENPPPSREVVNGEERTFAAEKEVVFLVLGLRGEERARAGGRVPSLLEGMAEPVLPEAPPGPDGRWSLERDFAEGRFVFTYAVAGRTDEGVRLALRVTLPGGDPCGGLRLTRAEGEAVFDPEGGRLVSSQAQLAFERDEEGGVLRSRGSLRLVSHGLAEMAPDEAEEAAAVHEAYFRILDLIRRKSLAAAEKAVDAFVERTQVSAYAEHVDALRERIPDTRTFQPRGLLARERFPFGALPWKKRQAPPIYVPDHGEVKDGAPRALACTGRPLPRPWWKAFHRGGDAGAWAAKTRGAVRVLHLWMSWLPPAREAVQRCHELAARLEGKGAFLLDVSLDTEAKSLGSFLEGLSWKRPLVWDRGGEAIRLLGLPGAPAFLVVDPAGVIRFGEVGYYKGTLERLERAAAAAGK